MRTSFGPQAGVGTSSRVMPTPGAVFTMARMHCFGRMAGSKYNVDSHRGHLELGDLRVRIERGVGEQVHRGFPEVHWNEHLTRSLPSRDPNADGDCGAARGHPNRIAVRESEPDRVLRG